jgi:mannosyltransferase OCH1-like enzyme
MIPNIFHQIWINTDKPDLPEKFALYRDSWLAAHPTWEYRLWNLENLDFVPRRIDLIKSAPNYAQMADILRYEILHRHGGVYLDTDFKCLRSIEPILHGVENFACSEDGRSISIGILGAVQGSVYMARCINALPKKVGLETVATETGPGMFTRVLLQEGIKGDFTLFPKNWFYPYNWNELYRACEEFPDSYGVHHWAHSWGDSEKSIGTRIRRRLLRYSHNLRKLIA